MKIHSLKTIQPYFGQVKSGLKTAELRKNDRDFKVGDWLLLQDFNMAFAYAIGEGVETVGLYTGDFVLVEITDVCQYPDALKEGWVMLSFKRMEG